MELKMSLAELIQASTQIVTAATAVVMAYYAYKTYLQSPEQVPESDPDTATDQDAQDRLNEVLVFKTSKQETWLTAKPDGLHCRIEDTRNGKGGPQWTISALEARHILHAHAYSVNPGAKVRSGTFSIGPRKNWLYSKSLFPDPDYLRAVIKELLTNCQQ